MTWLELSKLPVGARVEFTTSHDIYPIGIVPSGTRCTIAEQGLNEIYQTLLLQPETPIDWLAEWDGKIHLYGPYQSDDDWHATSPVRVVE